MAPGFMLHIAPDIEVKMPGRIVFSIDGLFREAGLCMMGKGVAGQLRTGSGTGSNGSGNGLPQGGVMLVSKQATILVADGGGAAKKAAAGVAVGTLDRGLA
ncbi:hypothetical protein DFO50_104164 [Microvirgula sp. AG722]|nr:hypothetical protein DFO50_104164 [Microvirgula sp. AG722]